MAANADESQIYPLYDTTFSLHRVSPLHTGLDDPLDDAILRDQARRFRDILTGEVLRGVRVGTDNEDSTLAHMGALQTVTWTQLPFEENWNGQTGQVVGDEDTTVILSESRGLLLRIAYEKMEYTAILLRDIKPGDWDETNVGENSDVDGFEHFPLLLLKMPVSLRDAFTDFLATTFDARISALQFPSSYVTTAFEQYLAYVCVDEEGEQLDALESTRATKNVMGAVEVFIGFNLPGGSSALKTMDIKLSRDDLPRIIARGKVAGNGQEDTPLWNALTAYVNAHLALDLKHERVKVIRIACDAFVLGAEGKVKFLYPGADEDVHSAQRRATRRLVNGLIEAARGGSLANMRP
ncbi:hypothetical protein GLAREA_09436 [Glarea lozoyensis ATCC 20868]|uniref:Siroheme synthase n=2 Tax=Glarea lozoyensis TaxID=101852 RepID=S3D8J6_GLAL2|nr:uncharacterized protein GLAREA_09436 [Glarea lozoyensis ATCC 20868]EHK98666.1 hypothetical protein M7I_5505 [Glarea lozoyensis 74030]EPE28316.1 hypothetical protein GLAREA_09436 [Glarea lozoyensis ATCC 20868]